MSYKPNGHNGCDCVICKRYRKYKEHLQRVPEEDRQFWEGIMEQLNCAESDLNYETAITIPDLRREVSDLRYRLQDKRSKV